MRINVYSQEITNEYEIVTKRGTDDHGEPAVFHGIRWFQHSAPQLHHNEDDDDRSAITIWFPKSEVRRLDLAETLLRMGNTIIEMERTRANPSSLRGGSARRTEGQAERNGADSEDDGARREVPEGVRSDPDA